MFSKRFFMSLYLLICLSACVCVRVSVYVCVIALQNVKPHLCGIFYDLWLGNTVAFLCRGLCTLQLCLHFLVVVVVVVGST